MHWKSRRQLSEVRPMLDRKPDQHTGYGFPLADLSRHQCKLQLIGRSLESFTCFAARLSKMDSHTARNIAERHIPARQY
jgi:hypothetical protein